VATSIGFDADELPAAGELAPDGAPAPLPDDPADEPEAPDGVEAAAGPDAEDAASAGAAPPVVVALSEFELPPLHPPMIAAATTANTPTDKCAFICGSPFLERTNLLHSR
jgi:hypothetical protein